MCLCVCVCVCVSVFVDIMDTMYNDHDVPCFRLFDPNIEGKLGYCKAIKGLPKWHSGKESACQCRRHRFDPWVRKISWNRKW